MDADIFWGLFIVIAIIVLLIVFAPKLAMVLGFAAAAAAVCAYLLK